MRRRDRHCLTASAVLVSFALVGPVLAQAPAQAPPAPQMPPSLVPASTVDLMSTEGSALFGAQWKTMEAKIVEAQPIPDTMPAYPTSTARLRLHWTAA